MLGVLLTAWWLFRGGVLPEARPADMEFHLRAPPSPAFCARVSVGCSISGATCYVMFLPGCMKACQKGELLL